MAESKVLSINLQPTKEMTLTKQDKINTFDMLSWAAMGAILLSIWQIVIPFQLFPLNKPQLFLGTISVVFLIVSLIVLYWSNLSFQFLKKKDLIEENPPLPTWHIEGTIFVTSFFLIACYCTCLIGILGNTSYSWALLAAKGVPLFTAQKEATIIIYCQVILIIGKLVILCTYIKQSYHLEFQPMHLPSLLGWFLTGFIFLGSMTMGDSSYMPERIGPIVKASLEAAEEAHESNFWILFIGIGLTLFFLFEQRSVQQESVPKVRFYFFPFLILILISAMLFINSLNFVYAASQVNKELKKDCKSTVQSFSSDYINSIGCPAKYMRMFIEGNEYYSQDCPSQSTGLVWEDDMDKTNDQKVNQVACMHLECCYLVSEERGLMYKQYFLYCFLTAFVGFIGAGHCFDLALQDPSKIKAGPSVYTQGKYITQIVLSFAAIFFAVFMSIHYEIKSPTQIPILKHLNDQINQHPVPYKVPNLIETIKECKHPKDSEGDSYEVLYDQADCIDSHKCNPQQQGFYVCLESDGGVFQMVTEWQSKEVRVFGVGAFNKLSLLQALNGQKTKDKFCAIGLQDPMNKMLAESLYICSNPGKQATIKFTAKQQTVNFMDYIQYDMTTPTTTTSVMTHNQESPKEDHTTVSLQIQDAQDSTPISGVEIIVYINTNVCEELDQSINNPIRRIQSDATGQAILYNLPLMNKPVYSIHVRHDGYYYNCLITANLIPFKVNSFYIPISKQLTNGDYLKVMLWYQTPSITLELGTNSIQSTTIQCNVAYFSEQCGLATYSSSQIQINTKVSKEIIINKLTKFDYLFYVKFIPQSVPIKQALFNSGLGLSEKEQKQLQQEMAIMLKSSPKVNIYIGNSQYPIQIYQMPVTLTDEINSTEQNLNWLVFCLDGTVGATKIVSIDHFWAKSDNNKPYQRRTASSLTIPDSSICQRILRQ